MSQVQYRAAGEGLKTWAPITKASPAWVVLPNLRDYGRARS